ncbi:hypothetical protein [Streptomyces sp. N2A]|uniref:hypothetical protein n=1 Tax=Streptomyces sp. N2A TaxID=3073936 RepID=UPI0028701A92|nr:hypothetical protein [Streptomyces sp. N2A]
MPTRTASRRLAAAAIAVGASAAILTPTAHAADASEVVAKKPAKLSVASYQAYLKKQKTPEAKKALKGFSALTKGQQATFVQDLQNRKIYEALLGQVEGRIGQPRTVIDPHNSEVRFVTKASTAVGKDKRRTTTVRFTVTEEIFKIPVTAETISISYPTAGNGPKRATATAKVANVNAAIAVTHNRVSVKGYGAQTYWSAEPQVASFGKAAYKKEHVLGSKVTYRASLTNNED